MNLRVALTLAIPLASLTLMAGCQAEPGDRLVGRWQGTGQTEVAGEDAGADAVGAAMGIMRLTLEFRDDRTGTSELMIGPLPDTQPNSLNGSWQVTESSGNRLVVDYSNTVNGEDIAGKMEIQFVDDNQISLKYPDNAILPTFLLTREKPN